MILAQVEDIIKAVLAALIFGGTLGFGIWLKNLFDDKKRKKLNEIDLTSIQIKKDVSNLSDDALRDKLDEKLKSGKS
jgi:hypothetical protein